METKTLDAHIEATEGVVGGRPRIAGRRISVQDIVIWHEWLGRSPEEIAADHDLTLADIHAALAYYYEHKEAVDAALKDGDDFVEAVRARIPSRVPRSLRAQED